METVVITGGSKGIGLELVKIFSKKFRVLACASTAKSVEEAKSLGLSNVSFEKIDMASSKEIKSFAQKILSTAEPLAALINNVGVFQPGTFDSPDFRIEDLRRQLEINLFSAVEMTEALKVKFLKQKVGSIINMSSIAGLDPLPNSSLYCTSKFALHGYSRALREDMKKHGIRVMTISPGATWTASWEGSGVEPSRLMPAQDIARIVYEAFSLSPNTVMEEIILRPQLGDLP